MFSLDGAPQAPVDRDDAPFSGSTSLVIVCDDRLQVAVCEHEPYGCHLLGLALSIATEHVPHALNDGEAQADAVAERMVVVPLGTVVAHLQFPHVLVEYLDLVAGALELDLPLKHGV